MDDVAGGVDDAVTERGLLPRAPAAPSGLAAIAWWHQGDGRRRLVAANPQGALGGDLARRHGPATWPKRETLEWRNPTPRLGYLKVVSVGPGGEEGQSAPTQLALRTGDAPAGGRLEELPTLGVGVMPYAAGVLLAMNDVGGDVYQLPLWAAGGGVNVSYDLSSALGWSESYLRAGVGILFARQGISSTAQIVPIDVAFEKGVYAGQHLTFYGALGTSMSLVSVDLLPDIDEEAVQELSATLFGVLGRAGLDILVSPTFALRVEATTRLNFSAATYSAENDEPVMGGFDRRRDYWGQLGTNLALSWML